MIRKPVSGERLFLLALCSLSLLAASGRNVAQSAQRTDAEVQHFVDSLLQKMTTEEKIGQLSQLFVFDSSDPVEKPVAKGEVGSLLFITDPAMINRLQHIAVEKSRLHIPLIFGYDVIHGFRTIFPVPGFGNFLNQDGARASYRNSRFTGASHPESKPLLCS